MEIRKLYLKNFRNYKEETINFMPGTNVLCGDNAQGKTNVLEALYMFAMGKSFRTPQDRDTILFGETYTKFELIYSDAYRENTIEIIILRDRKKQIKVNGVNITKLSELMGKFNVVLFVPEELGLVKEGPHIRRRFLDVALSAAKPKYYYLLGKYNKVLEQRNNLIKKLRLPENKGLEDTMEIWNEKLAEYGMEIVKYRSEYTEDLTKHVKPVHKDITGENLSVCYKTRFETKEEFLQKMQSSLMREIEQGCSLYGPHRDDLEILTDDKAAKLFASQGQQRSIVLSLKLVQADLLYEETGEYPVLLLDDILSELDYSRKSYLVKKIPDKQVIITCAGVDEVFEDGKINLFSVKGGHVARK